MAIERSTGMRRPRVRLYMFEGSNACLTTQLALAHKGIDPERVDLPPAAHALAVRLLGFPRTTVPATIIDGRHVQGTLDISEALEAAFPQPPLFPQDPDARRRVRDAEVWGERFQRASRRIFYAAARRDRRVFSTFLRRGRLSPLSALAVRVATPLIIRLASRAHGSTDERAQDDVRRVPDDLDRIDGWLADGTLGGELPNAADYQIAPNVRAMSQFADFVPWLDGRPCAAWARRIVPDYGAPVPAVLPPEWLRRSP